MGKKKTQALKSDRNRVASGLCYLLHFLIKQVFFHILISLKLECVLHSVTAGIVFDLQQVAQSLENW